MTELSPSALFAPLSTSMQKVSAAGQLVKGTQARVVSLVNGNDQPAMQPGELWIKGPQVCCKINIRLGEIDFFKSKR